VILAPRIRKIALASHVAISVGWLGAVAAFLAIAVVGLASNEGERVRAACLAMQWTGTIVILPLAVLSLVGGVVQSLGTTWGLMRHWWVALKLGLTLLATVVLFVHTQAIDEAADLAFQGDVCSGDLRALLLQLVIDSGAALLVLLVTTALGVLKPRGLTPFGRASRTASPRAAPVG
jgi:hypothetical protein